MKEFLTTVLTLACAALIVILFVIKGNYNKQHETDVGAINDYSNRLDLAQTQLTVCNGAILTFSNLLVQSRSASFAFSNQLTEAKSTIALGTEQITNLNRRVAEVVSENHTLGRRVMDLTNQVVRRSNQITLTESNLDQANKNYALLENRLRRDVAERVVVERKFDNPLELRARMQYLNKHRAEAVSAGDIYAGLGVEVTSNAFHVISPD